MGRSDSLATERSSVRLSEIPGGTHQRERFFRERLVLFGKVASLISFGFLLREVLRPMFARVSAGGHYGSVAVVAQAIGTGILVAIWLTTRSGVSLSRASLSALDVVGLLATMSAFVIMCHDIARTDPRAGLDVSIMTAGALLMGRAIVMPCTMKHAVSVNTLACVPVILLSFDIGAAPGVAAGDMVTMAVMWATTWVALATLASKVLYRLRERVQEARQLGQYTLGERLGEGAMGIVYRASHALLQRPTAVKLLSEERVGDKCVARFEREVRLTAKLSHPNTVTVFDFGRTPDGIFYYAMELLDGATLETIVERTQAFSPARTAHIIAQTASALAEAHSIGLIHRDIKPANIMLCEHGGIPDTVKVLDFGLVKQLGTERDAGLTLANVVTGTPQYMPPEALTRPDRVDSRSDIYSLGAVAFFLVTGEQVFRGETVVEVCAHHLHTPPRRASELVQLPARLDDLIHACLAKDPAARPQSADVVIERLKAAGLVDGWTRHDAKGWWTEHGTAVGSRGLRPLAPGRGSLAV